MKSLEERWRERMIQQEKDAKDHPEYAEYIARREAYGFTVSTYEEWKRGREVRSERL